LPLQWNGPCANTRRQFELSSKRLEWIQLSGGFHMPPKSGSHYGPSAEFLPLMISHSNKPWKARWKDTMSGQMGGQVDA